MFGLNNYDLELVKKALAIAIGALEAAPGALTIDMDRTGMEALLSAINRDTSEAHVTVPKQGHGSL